MTSLHRFLPTAAAALLLAACSRQDSKTAALRDTVAGDSTLARDLRKATADTAALREAADIATAPSPADSAPAARAPASPTMRTQKPPVRMAPAPRTDRTPSIPVNPPVLRGPASGPPAGAPPAGAAGAAARDAAYPIAACERPEPENQRRCLMAYLARSDAPLDRSYQALIADMNREAGAAAGQPEPDAVQRLRAAQRAWLVYRDTECRQRNRGQEGAIWAPVRAQCLGEFSARRADELAGMLAKRR
jgi:uncharacterized protein YecT (DUF1311 family)